MKPISTTSGKTPRAQIAELRRLRLKSTPERVALTEALEALDELANQCYAVIRMMRKEGNALRQLAVAAKQVVMTHRRGEPVDVEL